MINTIMLFQVYFGPPAKIGFQTYVFLLGIFFSEECSLQIHPGLSTEVMVPHFQQQTQRSLGPLGFPSQCSYCPNLSKWVSPPSDTQD